MDSQEFVGKVEVPKLDNWPGTFEAYKLVKPYIKTQIWNFVSAIGLSLIVIIILEIILAIIFRHSAADTVLNEVAGLLAGAFLQVTVITMYFKSLDNHEFMLSEVITYGLQRLLKMTSLLIVMYVLLIVSFVLLIVPFFFVLPRLYMAPYFLMYNDSTVSEALAASWHLTRGNTRKVYSIILLDIAIGLLVLTIIGIPFAVYWWIINTGSFALLAMYLAQPKKTASAKAKKLLAAKTS